MSSTRECLAITVARTLKAADVIERLADLFVTRSVPEHIRSGQGQEFVAKAVQRWITAVGARTADHERGSPWEDGPSKAAKPTERMAPPQPSQEPIRGKSVFPRSGVGQRPPTPQESAGGRQPRIRRAQRHRPTRALPRP